MQVSTRTPVPTWKLSLGIWPETIPSVSILQAHDQFPRPKPRRREDAHVFSPGQMVEVQLLAPPRCREPGFSFFHNTL